VGIVVTYFSARSKTTTIIPYAGKQIDVMLTNKGMNFVGTITYPKTINKPCPGVLLLPGFLGERDELAIRNAYVPNEGIRTQGIWERTALKLAEQNYVSLRIDYRYSGRSEGFWQNITLTGELSDAKVALKYLSKNPAVDRNKLAVCGLSQGGFLAACISSESLVKALVLWVPILGLESKFKSMLSSDKRTELMKKNIVAFTLPWGEKTVLKKSFFDSISKLHPLEEIAKYKGPLLNIYAKQDPFVVGHTNPTQSFMNAHHGEEKFFVLDTNHTLGVFEGPEKIDEVISKTIDWLNIYLKRK
jgi:hypothetical protein